MNKGLRLRECHAGRGLYHIPDDHARHRLLSCLNSDPARGDTILLHRAQRAISATLAKWPNAPEAAEWYAGSALLNAFALAENREAQHEMDLFELQPETRRILRTVLSNARLRQPSLLGNSMARRTSSDGLANGISGTWFCLIRSLYGDNLPTSRTATGTVPLLTAYSVMELRRHPSFCSGLGENAFPVADADLSGTAKPVRNGYQALRKKFRKSGFHFLVITWRWGLQFAMWVVDPQGHLAALRDAVAIHCRLLSDHLIRHGCSHSLKHPTVEVVID